MQAKHILPATLMIAALSLTACGHEAAQATQPSTAPHTTIKESPTMSELVINHATPRDNLITGGQPAPQAWDMLAKDGVTLAINLRADGETPERDQANEVQQAGMRYAHLPVSGPQDISADTAKQLGALLADAEGKVLVYCGSSNRVGALLALDAKLRLGMSDEDAIAFGQSAGLSSLLPVVQMVLPQAE